MNFGKKKQVETAQEKKISDEEMITYLGIQGYQVPEGYIQVESYPLNAPFSYAWIFQDESDGGYLYVIDELSMTKKEREQCLRLKNILEYELKASESR